MKLVVHTDGGSRGNPGEAAVGVVIEQTANGKRQTAIQIGKRIGVKTNNEAEYMAVIAALEEIVRRGKGLEGKEWEGVEGIEFYLDSLLVVSQLNGAYKVKQAHLLRLLETIRLLEARLSVPITYTHIPRAQNALADKLVNEALDTP